MSGTQRLTQRQVRCMEKLPDGHRVVTTRHGAPLVRRPNGQLTATIRVEKVQSYLEVHG